MITYKYKLYKTKAKKRNKINNKHIEKINKQLEAIENETDHLFNECFEKLNANSKYIEDKSLEAFEHFKSDVSTINYIFAK